MALTTGTQSSKWNPTEWASSLCSSLCSYNYTIHKLARVQIPTEKGGRGCHKGGHAPKTIEGGGAFHFFEPLQCPQMDGDCTWLSGVQLFIPNGPTNPPHPLDMLVRM